MWAVTANVTPGCGSSSNAKPVAGDEWKQFGGTTLNFSSENTAPTSAIAANLKPFTDPWGLIVAYLSFNLPFAIWIMNAFFADLPPSLEEAALVDGASRWTSFRKIAVPLVLPGIATTAILCLVFSWKSGWSCGSGW